MAPRFRFHLIANAHLDPVWLWDWREGMNEAINTAQTMLDLLDEFPELTVVRGEAALYEFIEVEAPELFARIRQMVQQERWEVVGGTFVQCDNNLPTTETIRRQFEHGQEYFRSRFGRVVRTAWFPDTFGHSVGLPAIMAANGIAQMAHCRPFQSTLPLPEPAYWWNGQGTRVLAYRSPIDWYCHERASLPHRLDAYLLEAQRGQLSSIAVLYGLGNHGGGPTRRMLYDLRDWAARHPEVEIIHSGLDRYFDSVRRELAERPGLKLPEYQGELGYCLRGCYSSMAKFKFPFRRTEHALIRAGSMAAIARAFGALPNTALLPEAWKTVLFNSFHDILPGSSIERAYVDQLAQVGGAMAAAQAAEFAAINALARLAETSVPSPSDDAPCAVPFLVCNPHPFAYTGPIEFEVQLDWRPLPGIIPSLDQPLGLEVRGPTGKMCPYQRITPENRAMTDLLWRVRIVMPVRLPAGGWQIIAVGYLAGATPSPRRTAVRSSGPARIENEYFTVQGAIGALGLQVARGTTKLFASAGLEVQLTEDTYGSWGPMVEESRRYPLEKVLEQWKIADLKVLEAGPELARLWVRFAGTRSRLDLTLSLFAESERVMIDGRLFLDERSARVDLRLPGIETALFEVPGGECERGAQGPVAGIGGLRATGSEGGFVFASDGLSDFRITEGALFVTIARATRYADDVPTGPSEMTHLPAVDSGEVKFTAVIGPESASIAETSALAQRPIIVQSVTSHPGRLGRQGSAFELSSPLRLLSADSTKSSVRLVIQNQSDFEISPAIRFAGQIRAVPQFLPWEIKILHFIPQDGDWRFQHSS